MLTATDVACGLVHFLVSSLVFGLAILAWFTGYRISCLLQGSCATVTDIVLAVEALVPIPHIVAYARNIGQQG